MEGNCIRAMMILEIIGRPPEHLTQTLSKLIEQIKEEKGVNVLDKSIKEPKKIEKSENFYSSFSEVEIEVEDLSIFAMLIFKYMPAHIEIISPESMVLTNNYWSEIMNEVARRLHGYDEVARILQIEKEILEKKLREILENKTEPKKEEKVEKIKQKKAKTKKKTK